MKTSTKNFREPLKHRCLKVAAAASLFGGGTLFDACEVRFHDAFIAGTTDFIYSFLDPATVLADQLPDTANTP